MANGADVNERCEVFKGTSLINAVYDGNEPLISLLLQQPGIQVNAEDFFGQTALHHAATHCSGTKGRKVIKLLLNFPGIDTEITNDDDQTPLMLAKEYDFRKVFVEEYEKKMVDDYAKAIRNNQVAETVKTAENNQMTRKRKRETHAQKGDAFVSCVKPSQEKGKGKEKSMHNKWDALIVCAKPSTKNEMPMLIV